MYICLLCLNVNCFIMFEIHLYLAITSLLILVTLSLFQNFFFYLIFIHFFLGVAGAPAIEEILVPVSPLLISTK